MKIHCVLTAVTGAAAILLAGCGGPAINVAAKADIDRQLVSRDSTPSVPAPDSGVFKPMPLAVGQWVKFKVVDEKSEPSILTYKILGEEKGAFWVESVNETYQGKKLQKLLVFFGSRTDPKEIKIRAIKTMDNGYKNELPNSMVSMMEELFKGALSSLILDWKGLPQEDAFVPAGSFAGCYKARGKAQWGPWKSEADSWCHPAVPINGLVRSKGVGKEFAMELLAYGLTGAVSEF
ncbi:MAG: hypothetical protein ABIW76_03815 [Fibrobacteria bacterium]